MNMKHDIKPGQQHNCLSIGNTPTSGRRRRCRTLKMAASLSRVIRVQRLVCCTVQNAEALLDPAVQRHFPSVIPFRTKKRYFIPPVVGGKGHSPDNLEARAGQAGVVVRQEYMERAVNISCTAGVFDPYIPPEGDARLSGLSKEGLKQRTEQLKQSAASLLAIRKIKELDSEFNTKEFPAQAQDIFIQAHDALTHFNKEKLHDLVTERCYPTLAIYDRFGRLMVVDEEVPRDVLEYLVLERHLVNPYSRWRLHGKIVPSWAPPKDPIIKTVMIPGPQLKPWEEFDELNYEVVKPKAVQWHK
ncbi:39S ribosomal protein L45, mitochondrial isoform X2 [Anguilla rostrata]|uniref:39S ribosomal protein L45, mitochondrial isoform X2 n=1 Tax=Anguilla rostrata TaxID=7938 RepID=UPI0030D4A725